ncbi:MAG: DUF1232 domain-containing protein [Dehalococcoidia bacterium]|nr:DUF1232 domain-containing protein [Dehalococcoidia bacterium]
MFSIIRLISFTGLPRLVFRLLLDRRVPLITKLILPAAIVYLVSPIDFFPDVVLPFGRLDDILALILAPVLFVALSPRQVVLEHMGRAPAPEDENKEIETTARTIDDDAEGRAG